MSRAPRCLVRRLNAKVESLLNLLKHRIGQKEISDTDDELQLRGRTYCESRPRKNRELNINKPSRISLNRRISNSPPAYTSAEATVGTTELIGAVESGEFDIDGTATMDSVVFCRVFMNDNIRASKRTQITDLRAFIRTHYRNFNHCRP